MTAEARVIRLAEHRRGPERFYEPVGINASWWLVALCCSLTIWGVIIGGAWRLSEFFR